MKLEDWKLYVPIASGALFTFLMLEFGDDTSTKSLYVLWVRETPFFVLSSIVGCLVQPKRPLLAALLVLAGVSLGVFFDVAVHPHDVHGYERNLFPIEMFFHTLFAVPGVFAVAAVFWVVLFIRSNREFK